MRWAQAGGSTTGLYQYFHSLPNLEDWYDPCMTPVVRDDTLQLHYMRLRMLD